MWDNGKGRGKHSVYSLRSFEVEARRWIGGPIISLLLFPALVGNPLWMKEIWTAGKNFFCSIIKNLLNASNQTFVPLDVQSWSTFIFSELRTWDVRNFNFISYCTHLRIKGPSAKDLSAYQCVKKLNLQQPLFINEHGNVSFMELGSKSLSVSLT